MRSSDRSRGHTGSQKKYVQDLINAGELTNIESVREFAAQRGWTLTRVGAAYVGIKTDSGERIRLFLPGHPKASAQGRTGPSGREFDFWIYALLGYSTDGNAYYVGQTRNLRRRLPEHVKRWHSGMASSALFRWAVAQGVSLGVVLLERVVGTQTQANCAEREWQQRAAAAGYDGLGAFAATIPNMSGVRSVEWPEEQVRARVRPLATVIDSLQAGRLDEFVPVRGKDCANEAADGSQHQ